MFKTNKLVTSLAVVFVMIITANAQDTIREKKSDFDYITKLKLEVRADFNFTQPFMRTYSGESRVGENSYGFVGRYFNLHMGGNLTKNLSYYFRQRIIANPGHVNFFDNTDFLYLNYSITPNWSVRVGKDALAVGGFEYDAAPIDVLYSSYYWDYFYCFQLAAGATFHTKDQTNHLTLQIANSPYVFYGSTFRNSLMSFNLLWSGHFGCFKTLYSINMFERDKGKFMNYIALGNQLEFNHFKIYLDLMHHATNTKQLLKNFAVISRADVIIDDQASLFAKIGYEQNLDQLEIQNYRETGELWDCLALPGQQYFYYGLGCEVRPRKCPDLRVHAFVANYSVRNDYIHPTTLTDERNVFNLSANVGITWDIDFVKYFLKK